MVDVGFGKEAADAKLRESLKLYARLPQTRKILFGGAHDGGYVPILNGIRTEGNLDKLVMLKGSVKIAPQLQGFIQESKLEIISDPELFLKKNLVPSFSRFGGIVPQDKTGNSASIITTPEIKPIVVPRSGTPISHSRGPSSTSTPATPSQNNSKFKKKNGPKAAEDTTPGNTPPTDALGLQTSVPLSAPGASNSATGAPKLRKLNPRKPITQRECYPTIYHQDDEFTDSCYLRHLEWPLLCMFYYGGGSCKHGANCKFAHDYDVTAEQVQEYRTELAITDIEFIRVHR
ncbi:hypothetical protein FRB99_001627 [Tulasnella sp. 403]|nr:hypothetical protein FRB99_001627 [Tulasnella sp. 403]